MSTRKKYIPKNIKWACDYDYLDKLSAKDKKWLEQFNDEYYLGAVKKGDDKALHNTDKLRKDCFNRKYKAQNDVMGIFSAKGKMLDVNESEHEIAFVDHKFKRPLKRRPQGKQDKRR